MFGQATMLKGNCEHHYYLLNAKRTRHLSRHKKEKWTTLWIYITYVFIIAGLSVDQTFAATKLHF